MTSLPSAPSDPRPIALRLRIDDICSAFEAAFGRETDARIEPFVPPPEEGDRPHVLAELIRTERECRQVTGDDPTVSEFLARFPRDAAAVRDAFAGSVLRPGERVGKYVVAETLGAGGMGVVYRATDELVGRQVALKVLSARLVASETARERLLAEARSVGRLSHPNVVTLYEAGNEQGACYLVMEHLAGGSAADRLERRGRFHWRDAVAVIADVCRGLSAAHAAGLVHLDVKPANILLTAEADGEPGTGVVAKVSDFGLARHTSEGDTSERIAGTPRYMAPEQTAGRPTDARTDVYGVGAALYALLTGAPPVPGFGAPDPRDLVSDLPAAVVRVVRRAIAPAPGARYQSINELLRALEGALEAPSRHRRRGLAVALAVLLGCGLMAWQPAFPPGAPPEGPLPDEPSAAAPPEPEPEPPETGPWEPLFDGTTLAGWEARPAPEGDLERRKLRGNTRVFTVTTVDGGPVIRGVPDGDWRLTTLRTFENYQLRLEYRWGRVQKGERPNSGVMYHYRCVALDANFEKIRFHELDLWPPEVGNLLTLPGISLKRDMDTQPNFERPAPAWNHVNLLCVGDRAVHVINGHVTSSHRDARIDLGRENNPRYTSGGIQLQALTGEVFFRNIQVRPIRAIVASHYR